MLRVSVIIGSTNWFSSFFFLNQILHLIYLNDCSWDQIEGFPPYWKFLSPGVFVKLSCPDRRRVGRVSKSTFMWGQGCSWVCHWLEHDLLQVTRPLYHGPFPHCWMDMVIPAPFWGFRAHLSSVGLCTEATLPVKRFVSFFLLLFTCKTLICKLIIHLKLPCS